MSSSTAPTKRRNNVEQDSKPPSKRVRKGKKDKEALTSSSVTIPLDALCFVMEFLSPRQLFNLAFTCKTLRAFVTTKLVVRSALIHGGHASHTIEELQKLLSRRAMHVPSPLRLLRLTNGKRCEFCKCSKVNHVRPYLGVFACWDCVSGHIRLLGVCLTKPWKTTWVRYQNNHEEYDSVFEHARVAANVFTGKVYMWASPRKNCAGERIGPLVTFNDVDKMVNWTRQGRSLPDYFSRCLNAPQDEEYEVFNQTFAETKGRAEQVLKEREEKKKVAKENAKGNKMAKIEKMVKDLAVMLDEPFREIALKYKELRYSCNAKGLSKLPCVKFDVPLIDELLRQYIITPSKIRKRTLSEIAETINQKLRLVAEKKFLSLDYLSDENPFEAALKEEFLGKLTDLQELLHTKHVTCEEGPTRLEGGYRCENEVINSKFFSLLEKNQLVGALAHLYENDFSCFFVPRSEEDADETVNKKSLKSLARTVWFSELSKEEDSEDDQLFNRAFHASQTCFRDAQIGIQGYMAWLGEKYPDDNRRRVYACDTACRNAAWAIPFLLSSDFEGLDKEQQPFVAPYFFRLWR